MKNKSKSTLGKNVFVNTENSKASETLNTLNSLNGLNTLNQDDVTERTNNKKSKKKSANTEKPETPGTLNSLNGLNTLNQNNKDIKSAEGTEGIKNTSGIENTESTKGAKGEESAEGTKGIENASIKNASIENAVDLESLLDPAELEEINKTTERMLFSIRPPTQLLYETDMKTFHYDPKAPDPFLEKLKYAQKDFLYNIQMETVQNIKEYLEGLTSDEIKAMVLEVGREEELRKKQAKKASKIDKIIYSAQQKALIDIQKPFIAMLNGVATNQLTNINTFSVSPTIDIITGNATIEKGTLKVFFEKYSELKGVRTSTLKLLDVCTMYLTKQNTFRGNSNKINTNIVIPLEQYMVLCGIPLTKSSKDSTRRKVKEDLETLFHMSLEWTEPSGKNIKDFAKMRICDKIAIIRGNISFNFSKDMAKYLTNAYIMQYPMELLKVDERNSNLYPLGRKLLLHHSMNNNRKKGTANIISVKALLEVCPDIPTYENVMSEGRQLDQRIKTPLEKALDSLKFINWEYSNAKGVPLTEEQLLATDFKTFEKLYVKFSVAGLPAMELPAEIETVNSRTPKNTKKKTKNSKNTKGK